MTDEPDIELVLARLLSDQQSADTESLTDEQTEQLAKAAQGLRALNQLRGDSLPGNHVAGNHVAGNEQPDGDTVKGAKTTQPTVEGSNPATEQVGRFLIKGTLGVGGHGLVFLAFDPKLERDVALKIPNMNAALDQESQQRFVRESRAAAILSHPSIVPVFESGNIGPVNYIVYRYCPGANLATWSKQNSLQDTPLHAARVVAQLSDAVEHAHQRGVVHRDLKPSNVLLESIREADQLQPDQLPECLRIADFGLAKFVADNTSLTQTRGVVGTPDYMSPEQANGSPNVGASSDIYSLGAMLYELLTGRPPHKQETLLATLKSVANDPVVAPRKLNPRVSRDLESICMKCLEKEAENRYSSAFELGEDLRAVLESRPVSVTQPTILRRAEKWLRRNPTLVRAAAASAVISLIVLGVALYWVNNARQDERSANQTAQANLQRAREIVKDFFVMTEGELEGLPGDSVIRKQLAERSVRYFEEFEQLVDAQDPQSLEDLAIVRARLGRILDSDNQFEQAITQFKIAVSDFQNLNQSGKHTPTISAEDRIRYQYQIARLQVDLGSAHMNLKENETGRKFNLQALETLRELNSKYSEDWINNQLINAMIDRSTILSVFGDNEEAQRIQEEAMSLISANEMTPSRRRKQAFLYMEMAKTHAVGQELKESVEHYQKAKSTFQELASHTKQNQFLNLMVARCNVRIVGLQRRLGQPNQRSIQDQQAIVDQMKNLATENPERSVYQYEYALGLFDLALLHADTKQLKNAININKELIHFIESTENRLGSLDAEGRAMLGGTYNNLASLYMQTQQLGLAETAIRSAIPCTIYALRKEPNNLGAQRFLINHYYGLGEILAALDRPLEAIAALESATMHAHKYCESHPSRTSNQVQLHVILGKRLTLLEQAGLRDQQLSDLKRRIVQSIFLLEHGESRFQNYYQREIGKDIRKLVGVLLEFHQDDAKKELTDLLASKTDQDQLQRRLLDAIDEELEEQPDSETIAFLEEIRSVFESDEDCQ